MLSKKPILLIFSLLLSGCSVKTVVDPATDFDRQLDYAPSNPVDVSHVQNALPKKEPRSRYGNPKHYTVRGIEYQVLETAEGYKEKGIASWYGLKFHGRKTSSAEPYDIYQMTAAHKTLPLPTYVKVTNLQNRKWVIVKVNDRGPFHANRIIDLSYAAASKLEMRTKGTALVEVEVMHPETDLAEPTKLIPVKEVADIDTVWIQLGAFSSNANALRMKNKLAKEIEQPINISENKGLYRVMLGPVTSLNALDRLTEKLTNLGVTGTHLVTEQPNKGALE